MKSCPHCNGTFPTHFSVCPQDGTPLRAVTELIPGAVIREKYQILEKLGEGGMGVVYKAQHVHFKEVCALKLVSSTLAQDPTFIQRFNAEALLMRRLDHPHALRVHDIDKADDGHPFIVMEYVDGKDLASLLREGALETRRAVNMVMQACEALGAAHRLGIIHRDIKPTNIMVARAPDGSDHVKVFDFGIAKVKEGSPLRGGGASLTQTGMVVGTPAYMSPEQCMGARSDKLDGRTDLYSLGIVLYEALTGHVPFSGETPMELVLAHIQKAPPDPRTIRAELPPALAEVVLRALEKDPEKRYATAEEMRDALKTILDTGEVNLGGTMRVMPHRAPTPARGTAPADVALTDRMMTPPPAPPAVPTAATPAAPPVQPAPRQPERVSQQLERIAPPPEKRGKPGVIIAVVVVVLVLGGIGYVALNREEPPVITDGLTRPPEDSSKKADEAQRPPSQEQPPKQAPAESAPARPARERPAGETDAQETQRMLQTAGAALDAGRYDEAIRTFEVILLLEPGNTTAQAGLNRARRAKAAEGAVLSKDDATRLACSRESSLRSSPSTAATALTFVNRAGQPVHIFWLNYEGKRVPYHELDAGESVKMNTFFGHPWLVADTAGNCIVIYQPASEPRTVEVRPY